MFLGGEYSSDKAAYVDVSTAGVYDDVVIVIPFPKKIDNSRALFAIYSPTVIYCLNLNKK